MRLTRRRFLLGCAAVPVATAFPPLEGAAEPLDLMDVIYRIDPVEVPFLAFRDCAGSMIRWSKAQNRFEWIDDELTPAPATHDPAPPRLRRNEASQGS